MLFIHDLHRAVNQQVTIMRVSSILGHGWIFAQPAIQAQTHHAKKGLAKDTTTHFAHALTTIDEDHRHLFYFEPYFVGGVFHLNLEAIALETNLIQWDCFKNTAFVALESGRCIMHVEARHQPDVLGGEVAHQHSSDGPVHYINTTDVA